MVEIPIYHDSEDSSAVCECCRKPIPSGDEVIDCINRKTNSPVKLCLSCFDASSDYIKIDECMPSGDVVM